MLWIQGSVSFRRIRIRIHFMKRIQIEKNRGKFTLKSNVLYFFKEKKYEKRFSYNRSTDPEQNEKVKIMQFGIKYIGTTI